MSRGSTVKADEGGGGGGAGVGRLCRASRRERIWTAGRIVGTRKKKTMMTKPTAKVGLRLLAPTGADKTIKRRM